jgi:catechol 2,3-dioxygenase-like lactoylglutathione lyase family enzyme
MYSHTTVGTNDLNRAKVFYDAIMEALGQPVFVQNEQFLAYGTAPGSRLFVVNPFDGRPATVGNGTHIAFEAPDRAAVDRFYEAAIAHGGSDEGPPGPRPHYHANYYGAYVRDPDGNKLQAVCHRSAEAKP